MTKKKRLQITDEKLDIYKLVESNTSTRHQASKSIYGLLWPWPLTSWPQSWSFQALVYKPPVPIGIKTRSLVFNVPCSQVWQQTNKRQIENTTPLTVSLAWSRRASDCQSGLVHACLRLSVWPGPGVPPPVSLAWSRRASTCQSGLVQACLRLRV